MTIKELEPVFVESFPTPLHPGALYVSTRFSTAAHLCACGCGREVITPLSPAQWAVKFDGAVSVWPSIGNWTFPCRSHYIIDRGRVRWSRDFTDREVRSNQASDQCALSKQHDGGKSWITKLLDRLR